MLEKLIKKDRNAELERILEEKQIDEHAKNLLQGILYKIEVSYNDYKKAKVIDQTEEQYVEKLIANIKKNCNKINVVKLSQKLEDEKLQEELKRKKFYVSEKEIISYPIEEKLLYAIEKKCNNDKILNNKYNEISIAISDFINMGKDIDRVEVLRDFNGWSWTTIKREIENIDANLIFQTLQLLFGKEFLDNWCQDKDGIIDYFEVMEEEKTKYGKDTIEKIKDLLIKIAIVTDVEENPEFANNIRQKLDKINKELEDYDDTQANIERISEHRKQAMKQLKDLEKVLGQEARLKVEYEKRNKEAPIEKKIFNIKVLKRELSNEKEKLINEINEDNYLLNPMNYIKEKEVKQDKKQLLEIINIDKEEKEALKIDFIKEFLKCINTKIKNINSQDEIVKQIYKFRYFMCLPFNSEKDIKDVKKLAKDITETEKELINKAIEKKVISDIPFEVMKHVFETRIIILEQLYYKITKKSDKYYVQIFDENITEEKFEIKQTENVKTNKKIKIFI